MAYIFVDKSKGITSHDVIDRVRKITGVRRTGHAGTLDPNATGLLIVGIGRESTKELWTKFGKLDKTYIAEIILGEEREGDDATGEILTRSRMQVRASHSAKSVRDDKTCLNSLQVLSNSEVRRVLNSFIGEQMQVPPIYSAIKIHGKPAYKYARNSLSLSLSPRKVTVHSIKLLGYKFPIVRIETKVSSGTYIRALARDIGRKLGCGAYLSELRRVRIGKYRVEDSHKLEEIYPANF